MLIPFTFFISLLVVFVWTFETKANTSFNYPAIFGFFTVLTYVAIPYATMAFLYVMAYQYPQLKPYINYQTGLIISMVILGPAFIIKKATSYIK